MSLIFAFKLFLSLAGLDMVSVEFLEAAFMVCDLTDVGACPLGGVVQVGLDWLRSRCWVLALGLAYSFQL